MRNLLFGLIVSGMVATSGFAGDSTWLLGDDGHIAVNTLEHREKSGRATDIALIYGSHFLKGALSNLDAGRITLTEIGSTKQYTAEKMPDGFNNYIFKGEIKIDYNGGTINLKGKIKFTADDDGALDVNTTFKCKEMQSR